MGRFFSPPRAFCSRRPGEGVEIVRHAVEFAPLAGTRAVFLSDIHVSRRFPDANLEALFARVAALEPDILLLGGDLAEDEDSLKRLLRVLGVLRPPLGVFTCLGNNDAEIAGFAERAGGCVRVLVNESVRLGALAVGGVDEIKWGTPRAAGLFPEGADVFRLLLAHYPVAQDYAGTPPADLQLSGHTHGGQFNVLGVTPYTVFYEARSHAWISGECRLNGVRVVVSNGVGMSRFCLRVGVPPQMHLLEFVGKVKIAGGS